MGKAERRSRQSQQKYHFPARGMNNGVGGLTPYVAAKLF
jgi:hypothetical protein